MLTSILIVAVIAFLLYIGKRWQSLPEKERKGFAKKFGLYAAVGVILALVMTGRAHWLMGVLAALLALAARVSQFAQYVPLFKKMMDDVSGEQSQQANPASVAMTRKEAAEILGVEANASEEEIRLAHKSLMQKIHPDRGGSDGLAKQLNQAKEVMLA